MKMTVGCDTPEQIILRGGRGIVDNKYAQDEKGNQDFYLF